MESFILSKTRMDDFIKILTKKQKVYAPVKKGVQNYVYSEVTDSQNVLLKHIPTILPPKKFFMPQYETLIEYDTRDGQKMEAIMEYEDIVLLGVHTCDIEGIQCLTVVYSDRPKDLNFLIRKNHITLIGIECNDYCDDFASCAMMDNHLPAGGYDLFFTDLGDNYFVDIGTKAGEDMVRETGCFGPAETIHFKELQAIRDRKKSIFKNEVNIDRHKIPEMFVKTFESKVWDDVGRRCLACGNCTNVCPTCYCFDVMDEPNMDLKTGKRIRVWDSCQNEPFAKISSGENFRSERKDRKRHRFNRKFLYPFERYSRFFCIGCGRCSRTCMAKINLKETINQLIEENAL